MGVEFRFSKNPFGYTSFSIERSELGETILVYCLWLGGDRSSPWLNELQWEYYLGSVKIHLDVHRSLFKGLSSVETIVLYCLWLGGDRSSPWFNELQTEFVYLLLLSSSDLGFTTANF